MVYINVTISFCDIHDLTTGMGMSVHIIFCQGKGVKSSYGNEMMCGIKNAHGSSPFSDRAVIGIQNIYEDDKVTWIPALMHFG